MKRMTTVFFLMFAGLCVAQKPETVYSVAKEQREMSWYEQQQKLWKAETVKNKSNANAWYNYYSATRAMRNSCYDDKNPEAAAAKRAEYAEQCNQITEAAYKAVPESFEANHIKWWNSGNQDICLPYLMKAYEINPNDPRIYDDMAIRNELTRNHAEFHRFCVKMYESAELPASVLNWGYNLLSELDENAVVFTVGDNDTYAAWIVQEAKNYRKDVQVINTYLLQMDDYRNKLFSELKLPPLNIKLQGENSAENYALSNQKILDHILKNTAGIPVYVSTSGISNFKNEYEANFFLTGLAYKYSATAFDNISLIRRNYEKRYLLDYLKENFAFHYALKNAEYFDGMYMPSLLKLYKHYRESEEFARMKALEELILNISTRTGQQSEVSEVLGQDKSGNLFLTALLDVKSIEKNMAPVSGKVLMSKYETTNGDYQKFLDNLLRSRQSDLFRKAVYDSTQWVVKFPYPYNEPMRDNYHWNASYAQYPVVNISFEAANAYCEWLTAQYNMQRNRQYAKVIFRLPSEQEWKYAAGAGNEKASSGFPGNQVKNAAGNYLANLKTGEGRYYDDGAFHTAKVDNYAANSLGFYCMTGNAAEMINKKGIAKGGSWYHTFEESDFQKNVSYSGPDPGIGFRIVMEIIEE